MIDRDDQKITSDGDAEARNQIAAQTGLGVTLGFTALMCIVIAGVLWLSVPAMQRYPFSRVLVHSFSIGLIAAVLTVYSVSRLGQKRKSSALWLTGLLVPVSFAAFLAGSMLAKALLGIPIDPLGMLANRSDTVSLITTIVATAVCAGFFISRDQLNKLKLQAANDSHRAGTARLAMLQAQVEPHMLFNTLANLRALITTDPERALLMLDQLDGFLRMTLEGSRKVTHRLSDEFAGIEHYLIIMQIRLDDRLSYTLELPEAVSDIKVPSLLIQPVVENAIRHGIEPALNGGHIAVTAWLEGDLLILEVTDSGVGTVYPQTINVTQTEGGFGLHSLRERLPDVGGRPAVSIESPPPGQQSGTRVLLRVQT